MSKKKSKNVAKALSDEKVKDVDLLKFARKNYYEYGTAVLEDRAIPDFRDGMNPVNRRALWSCYDMGVRSNAKLVKSARIVGDTMGRFHPHGDSSLYNAVVGMTKNSSNIALVHGSGNWGSMSEPRAAAMRYTEMKLSKFSDNVLFNRFYTPIIERAPNYDGSLTEPVLLPALLPIVLLNGKDGIAPGATTYVPTFTPESIVNTLKAIYEGATVDAKFLYQNLEFTTLYGGKEVKPEDKEAKVDRLSVFKNTTGRVTFKSTTSWDEKTRTLTVTRFARVSKIEKLLENLLDIEGVAEARDDSTKHDKYATITVVLKKGLLPKKEAAIVKHIREKMLRSRENYVLNFTERYVDNEGQCQARMIPMTMVEMITKWVEWRTELERKACKYWIAEADKQIRYIELMMLAVDNRKIIIESLDKDCTQEELEAWLAKKLKITPAEAAVIYDLKVRQLRKLERKELEKRMKEIQSKRKELKSRHDKPEPWMAKQLTEFTFEE